MTGGGRDLSGAFTVPEGGRTRDVPLCRSSGPRLQTGAPGAPSPHPGQPRSRRTMSGKPGRGPERTGGGVPAHCDAPQCSSERPRPGALPGSGGGRDALRSQTLGTSFGPPVPFAHGPWTGPSVPKWYATPGVRAGPLGVPGTSSVVAGKPVKRCQKSVLGQRMFSLRRPQQRHVTVRPCQP